MSRKLRLAMVKHHEAADALDQAVKEMLRR